MIHSGVRKRRVNWFTIIAALGICFSASVAHSQSVATTAAQLAQRLEQPITIAWHGQQLRSALERLAETQGIAIWIDRRIDPATPIELSLSERPLREALAAVAESHDWAVSQFHSVVYVGPMQTAADLATLSALARQSLAAANETKSRWLRPEPWSIPRLSQPQQLLKELATSVGAQLRDDHLVPHDLWPARSLPPMPAVDRIVLLLSGFDLACQISSDGRQLHIVPATHPAQLTRSYTINRTRAAAVDKALASMPSAKATRSGTKLTLSARVEEHEQLRRALGWQAPLASSQPLPRAPANKSAQRFTLKITNQPAGRVIDQLAQQLKLKVTWDAALQESPSTGRDVIVSCDVRQVDLDGLLAAILSPAGLTFERDDLHITIRRGQ